MNDLLLQPPYVLNEKRWYLLSVFYAREKWEKLITEIDNFFGTFRTHFFSFSEEYGDHLQITFVTSNDNCDYSNDIQAHFQKFVDQYPSKIADTLPYGKILWCNYPNNSLIWNRYSLSSYSEQYINFHKQTIRVALKLMANDFLKETIFSAGLYLITKALMSLEINEQKNILKKKLDEVSIKNSYDYEIVKKLLSKIDENEIYEVIKSYKNENTNEYSLELLYWLDEVRNVLNTYNYNIICHFICKILGLTELNYYAILELLYKNYFDS